MIRLTAFLRLIRWPNLLFIALTQCMFRYFVLPFVYSGSHTGYIAVKLSDTLFMLLVAASVSIAAGGYIINDYFDVNIDHVNKGNKVIVGSIIKKRSAIVWHALLSLAGLSLSIYVGLRINNLYLALFNFLAILMLWFYSTTFKKRLLIGNVIISLLTAWVILVMTLAEFRFRISTDDIVWQRLLKVSFIYAGFACIISLVREVVKDMEDIEGDMRYGCKTMPIVWGVQVSKVFCAVWIVVLVVAVSAMQFYVLQLGWWFSALYSLLLIIIPLGWVLRKLYNATSKEDFHRLSIVVKMVMFTGIISMVFF